MTVIPTEEMHAVFPSVPGVLIIKGRSRGFTLMELLAAVGIVACLVALLVPTINSLRQDALNAKTMGRMKALSSAYMLFISENNQQVVPRSDGNLHASAPTGDLTAAMAPFLELKETGSARLASPVWWDATAEKNGTRKKDNSEGDLHYPDPPAWAGGPPRNKLTGFYFNPFAHQPNGVAGNLHDKYAFGSLGQIGQPTKTALLISRRADSTSGDTAWNSWSDGKKYSSGNLPSLGAKRLIMYFDGHLESVKIVAGNYSGGGPVNASDVKPEYIFAEPVFYAWK